MSLKFSLESQVPNFTKATVPETISAIVEYVRKFLLEQNLLPPKTEVLQMVDEIYDLYVGPSIKSKLVRAIANELLLVAVGELYDQIAGE